VQRQAAETIVRAEMTRKLIRNRSTARPLAGPILPFMQVLGPATRIRFRHPIEHRILVA
jgi:hypothetical protein